MRQIAGYDAAYRTAAGGGVTGDGGLEGEEVGDLEVGVGVG